MVGGYCASKYALEALSNAQRMELSGSGVSLSLVEPGPILSNFRQNAFEMLQKRVTENDHFYANYNQTLKRKKVNINRELNLRWGLKKLQKCSTMQFQVTIQGLDISQPFQRMQVWSWLVYS